ncbi:acyclic terpene utilization AtuA family protein [Bradyrhizobium sp. LHD-71]|uniref:acyclic terpene utilization AtuA family protein n=1 Tax=Bradyrhizobium sp. LHD-71 TaxID=3072141 RepID=UPI00281082EF|nr:acyclic terpene utilization AtuA family protein [Bradyrhizobium sp. LHD-71]MDQ8727416.1 acyclic terpene utilization AtuA family protein [Bradyrhizobium sp. LHD-71]
MTGKSMVRIGCGAGFWGDSDTGAVQLVERGNIDYLVFDYLAEITMSLLTRAKLKDPQQGYATDFVTRVMAKVLPQVAAKAIKVVTNAGGVNPIACRAALQAQMDKAGVKLKVAVVLGDDLFNRAEELRELDLRDMDNGAVMPSKLLSANAYLGARGIAQALSSGADVVITGRCVDSAVVLGPLMHEFGWADGDYDQLSGGSLLGHLVECGCMGTGGLFSDWSTVPGWENMGFPIIECRPDGSGTVTKVAGTGGLVTPATVAEQMVYEIGDPAAYLLPDVTCDWRGVTLMQEAADRVAVSGARGRAPTASYKVCATYPNGWRATTSLTVTGGDAAAKARRVAEAILAKARRVLRQRGLADFLATSVELVGAEEVYGAQARVTRPREVMLKMAVHHADRGGVETFALEIMPALTATAPGIAGFFAGRPAPVPVVRLFSFLLDKTRVPVTVDVGGALANVAIHEPPASAPVIADGVSSAAAPAVSTNDCIPVRIGALAFARSGDKGDSANIGVVARQPEYYELLRTCLTDRAVADLFAHYVKGRVRRYEVPGVRGLNFLLERALGGGGIASLRIDPQGKNFASVLLDMTIPVPRKLAIAHGVATDAAA